MTGVIVFVMSQIIGACAVFWYCKNKKEDENQKENPDSELRRLREEMDLFRQK